MVCFFFRVYREQLNHIQRKVVILFANSYCDKSFTRMVSHNSEVYNTGFVFDNKILLKTPGRNVS